MRIRNLAFLAEALAAAVAGSAVASEPSEAPPASAAGAAPAPAPGDTATEPSPYCLTATGTHIPPKDGQCVPAAPGRVITRDDIEKSGATSVSEAVRKFTLR